MAKGGFYLAEMGHVVNVLPPVDITGGKAGDRFHMKRHAHASIIVQVGVSAAAFTKILVKECDADSGGNANPIAFKCYKEETPAGDTLSGKVSVDSAGVTPNAADNIMYVIEIDADELTEGFPWVEVSFTNGSNSVIASAVAILSGSRFAHDQNETVIA